MSNAEDARNWPPGREHWRKARGTKISLEGPPSQAELDQHALQHRGEAADQFSLYTPAQIDDETRTVRLDLDFSDLLKVRDQFEMIAGACQIILATTRKHDLGSVRQRIEARREAASLARQLALMQGKTPRGVWKPRKRRAA